MDSSVFFENTPHIIDNAYLGVPYSTNKILRRFKLFNKEKSKSYKRLNRQTKKRLFKEYFPIYKISLFLLYFSKKT